MGENSKIEWTHHTFNPWWGCTRVSPGCEHCYAETFAKRTGLKWGPRAERRFFGEKHWHKPVKWNREAEKAGERRLVFCASMADVFEDRPELEPWRQRLWKLIDSTPSLNWLLLSKRPENAVRMAPKAWMGADGWPVNVWAMTTAEDQKRAEERIPLLLDIPAVVRGLSVEPLLGPIDLTHYLPETPIAACPPEMLPYYNAHCALHWVIVGGESGHGARPVHPAWVRSLRDQCVAAGVPFFFKQWGEHAPAELGNVDRARRNVFLEVDGTDSTRWTLDRVRIGKTAAGRVLDGRTWDEMPEVAR